MSRSKFRNLFLIGNGFDRWQGLPTSYGSFHEYFLEHVDEALEALGIEKLSFLSADGKKISVSPVEIAYGDPFSPDKLPPEFFGEFENSLDKLDDQLLNLYYGRSKKGIKELSNTVRQAQAILRRVFSDWIRSIEVTAGNNEITFGDDCFFINFNYTDTLVKKFGVKPENIYHIHGKASDPDSIVVGHSTHPETPFRELIEQHFIKSPIPGRGLPRIEGLYWVEDALYRTDKHVADRIDLMCKAFMDAGLHIEDIENIYVLGHSFSAPDREYFDYIDKITRCGVNFDALSAAGKLDRRRLSLLTSDVYGEAALLKEIQLNLVGAMTHRREHLGKNDIPFPEWEAREKAWFGQTSAPDSREIAEAREAVHQRFLLEQSGRTQDLLKEIAAGRRCPEVPPGCYSVLGLAAYLDGGHDPRKKNAAWYISYFSPEDKKRIEKTMKQIGLKRYALYNTIEGCMEAGRR